MKETTTYCDACHTEVLVEQASASYEMRSGGAGVKDGQIVEEFKGAPREIDFHAACIRGLDTNPPSAGATVGMPRATL